SMPRGTARDAALRDGFVREAAHLSKLALAQRTTAAAELPTVLSTLPSELWRRRWPATDLDIVALSEAAYRRLGDAEFLGDCPGACAEAGKLADLVDL